MSLASRFTSLFASSSNEAAPPKDHSTSHIGQPPLAGVGVESGNGISAVGRDSLGGLPSGAQAKSMISTPVQDDEGDDFQSKRPPYLHSMVAGGLGGSTGDMLMHSLDTVKTRQQGAPTVLKYSTMGDAYATIFREEGFRRGLYGGVTPAFMGSLPGTMIFFGSYEYSKRHLLDMGCPESMAYFAGGLVGDLFASVVYVPSEVLKTRLQLQGRYNNPHFNSGYNYRNTLDAARTIFRTEGPSALFHGYKATIMRDLPFSALQFAFYEEFQQWAKLYRNSRDIGIPLEIITGGAAGGLAGVITCPLDVVKTRIQTQVNPPISPIVIPQPQGMHVNTSSAANAPTITQPKRPSPPQTDIQKGSTHRTISTSSPSTTPPPKPGTAPTLNTSSIIRGLQLIYRTEGIQGWFRGVGPRMVWTSVQSGTMLVLYQSFLKYLENYFPFESDPI